MRRDDDNELHTEATAAGPRRGLRVWRRPRILDRQHIEAMAADCGVPGGKSDPTCLVPFS